MWIMQRAQKLFLNHTTYQLDQIVTFEKVNLGLSNSTYYVKTIDDKEFQVRITENNDIISRTCEYAVIQALSVPYLYYDLENGNSIRTWIHGKNPTNLEIDHTFLDQLVLAIKKIHQTDLCLLNNQVPMHNNKCFYEIPGVQQIDAKFLELYSTLTTKHQDLPKNLSHNDISLLNVI